LLAWLVHVLGPSESSKQAAPAPVAKGGRPSTIRALGTDGCCRETTVHADQLAAVGPEFRVGKQGIPDRDEAGVAHDDVPRSGLADIRAAAGTASGDRHRPASSRPVRPGRPKRPLSSLKRAWTMHQPAGWLARWSDYWKVAVTLRSAVIEIVQVVAVPLQPPPDQPPKVEPPVAAAVRTTLALPGVNRAEQVAPQEMPAGADVTVPVPAPALVMFSARCPASQLPPAELPPPGVKVPFRQKQSPLPARTQHPAVIPAAPIAVSHPSWQAAAASWPRLRSTGVVVSVAQLAFEAVWTVVHPNGGTNVAVTVVAAVTATVQVAALPEQPPPDQPAKVEPVAAAAVKTTLVL
jgi:hypothetical protein